MMHNHPPLGRKRYGGWFMFVWGPTNDNITDKLQCVNANA